MFCIQQREIKFTKNRHDTHSTGQSHAAGTDTSTAR